MGTCVGGEISYPVTSKIFFFFFFKECERWKRVIRLFFFFFFVFLHIRSIETVQSRLANSCVWKYDWRNCIVFLILFRSLKFSIKLNGYYYFTTWQMDIQRIFSYHGIFVSFSQLLLYMKERRVEQIPVFRLPII